MTNSVVPNSDTRLFYVVTYMSSDESLQGFVIDPAPQAPFLVRTFTDVDDAVAFKDECGELLPYVGDASITYEVVPFGLSSPLPVPSTTSVVYLIEFWHDDTPGNRRFVTDENTMQVWATTDYTLAREDAERRQTHFTGYTYEVVTINVPGLALPFDPTLIAQRDEARRDLQAAEAILVIRDGQIAEQTTRISQLARELREMDAAWDADVERISDDMIETANDKGFCSTYDTVVRELNRHLTRPIRERKKDYNVSMKISFSLNAVAEASDDDEACDAVEVTEYMLIEAARQAYRDGSWESDDIEASLA